MQTIQPLLPAAETMYRALLHRDRSFEGIFVVAVTTTGIFCRPTCSAKKPARENVEFFSGANEALHAGFRPCLRCRPMELETKPPQLVLRLQQMADKARGGRMTDKELAAAGIDASTARRQFRRHFGMTFQAYCRARRIGAAMQGLRRGALVEDARSQSGFESEAGFREAFSRVFGAPPTDAKRRAPLYAKRLETPLGAMIAIADDDGLRLLEFADRRALERELPILRRRLRTNAVPGEHAHLAAVAKQLREYFAGERLTFDVPLAPVGSEFQLRAWETLRSIPPAETRSYQWEAKQLGIPNAMRAVGRANGTNMISIVIPCHRVIRADGSLCGYGGGLWRKRWLLDHERRVAGRLQAVAA